MIFFVRYIVVLFSFAVFSSSVSCSDEGNARYSNCLESLNSSCDVLYEPTFEQVFQRTLKPSCAVQGACHSSEGAAAGLRLDEIEKSHAFLLESELVVKGDPSCSLLMKRLQAKDEGVMPPGKPLSDAERCAVQRWIANGAKR